MGVKGRDLLPLALRLRQVWKSAAAIRSAMRQAEHQGVEVRARVGPFIRGCAHEERRARGDGDRPLFDEVASRDPVEQSGKGETGQPAVGDDNNRTIRWHGYMQR